MDNETFRYPNCCNSAREESLLKSTKTIFLTLAILQNPMSMQLSDYVTSGTLHQRPIIALVGCHQGNEHKKQAQVQEPACFFFYFYFFIRGSFLSLDLLTPQKFSAILMYMIIKFSYCVYHHKKELVPQRGFGPICGFIC